jgi:putative transposase
MAIETTHKLSVRRQCVLLGLHRSGVCREPATESEATLDLMRWMDEHFTRCPYDGSRKMVAYLGRDGHRVNRKRVQRLMRVMGLETLYCKPNLSRAHAEHVKYPYLLRGMVITRPDHVWSTDITYIRMRRGFMYLTAVLDWYSRYVLSWRLSNTLDNGFCLEALGDALRGATPVIFNTDQGVQFTSRAFTQVLKDKQIQISMDGKGRALDNVFVERLWRTVKYEEVYLKEYESVRELEEGLGAYFSFYNDERLHQALDYRTPKEVYCNNNRESPHKNNQPTITLN